jgi:uncharacterized protein (TIGR02145 family)|tara:strand:- start:53 stop:748 length:696 start_codon:yes stop_codon:yes gene_type:complete
MENVKDIDGNSYKTVRIRDQIWMAENLKVTRYRNGDQIPTGYGGSEWHELKTDAFAVYDDNPLNAMEHGNLYNWYAVVDERNISPKGWHVACLDEWNKLIDFLEIEPEDLEEATDAFLAQITGRKPKPPSNRELARRDKYKSPKMRAFNLTDSGSRSWVGHYLNNEYVEHVIYSGLNDAKNRFWTSDKVVDTIHGGGGINMGYLIALDLMSTEIKLLSCKESGFSVRCVKD